MALDNTNLEVDPMEEELRRRAEQSAQGYTNPSPTTNQTTQSNPTGTAPTPYTYNSKERDRIVQGWAKSGNAYTNDRAGIQNYLTSLGDAGKGWRLERDDKVYDPNNRIFDWIGKVGTAQAQKRTGYTTDSRYAAVTGSKKPPTKLSTGKVPSLPTGVQVNSQAQATRSVTNPTQPINVPDLGPGMPVTQERDPRWDEFYTKLKERADQGLNVDRTDPAVRAQSDAYAANEERAKRQHLAQVAEESGPNANLRMENRMANERVGQRSGAFEAELMGREIGARRDEIASALSQMQGMLTVEQENSLRQELAKMDDLTRRYQTDVNARTQKYSTDKGFESNKYNTDVGASTSRYNTNVNAATARRGQDFGASSDQLRNEQFLAELGFRQSDADRLYDLRYRGL